MYKAAITVGKRPQGANPLQIGPIFRRARVLYIGAVRGLNHRYWKTIGRRLHMPILIGLAVRL